VAGKPIVSDEQTILGAPPTIDDDVPQSLQGIAVGKRGAVLVVETDPARSTASMLDAAGFAVQVTDDGVRATQLLATAPFEALVTDLAIRELSGLALLRFVRAHDHDLPVILMSAVPDVESALEAVELGAFQYLQQPTPEEKLVGAVDRAVASHRSACARQRALDAFEDHETQEMFLPSGRMEWDSALRRLWMAYQPIVLPGGQLYAYEALVRSDEPTMRGPGDLLNMAEQLGELRELGRRIRTLAGSFALGSQGQHFLFVNLHADDLRDETLSSPAEALSQVARAVVLEITERAAVHDIGEAKAKMAELRAMGFRIALDDLGAGYAGLTSFAELRPDVVKLDMALVRGIHLDPVKRKLVASVIDVSRDIGTTVVGEGVETVEERDVLIELGCHLLQGYLYGKPKRL